MARKLPAAIGLLAMLVGAPLVLLEFAGAPTLQGLPDLDGLRRAVELRWIPVEWAIQILALLAWALWAYLILAVLLRVAGHIELRLRSAGRIWTASETYAWSPVKLAVDLVVGAAILGSTMTHSSARSAPVSHRSGWATTLAPHVATLRSESTKSHGIAEDRSTRSSDESSSKPSGRTIANGGYIVRPGDSLWSIAERTLDDPYRWTEIWELNQGREMPDGERLRRPGYIRPGWTLRLPETKHDRQRLTANDEDPRKAGKEKLRNQRSSARSDRTPPGTPTVSPTERPIPHPYSEDQQAQRIELPSGTSVALGFVGGFLAAVGVRELQRRRHRRPHPIVRGWPRAEKATSLKARLIRAVVANPNDVVEGEVEEVLKLGNHSAKIVLGHRLGSPVAAERQGVMYAFTGEDSRVLSYLRDLALHSLFSARATAEVWTTDELNVSPLNGLKVFADPRALVSELEVEILKRHRMLDEEGLKDWESHQEEWPDDPLPYVVGLLAGGVDPLRNRLAAIATQGQELGLLVFGRDSAADGIRVYENSLQPYGRFEELLGEPFEAIRISDEDQEELLKELAPRSESNVLPGLREDLQAAPDPAGEAETFLRVSLFGPPTILLGDEELSGRLRRKSRELLAFFLLHPQGVGREQVTEALWPETDPDQASEKFWKQLGDMRRGLRSESNPTAKFVERSGDIYRVETDEFDVDVWCFDHLLAKAAQGNNPRETLAAAADQYRGELLEGVYYDWALPLRDHFRSQATDVLVELAEACKRDGDLEETARALNRAIGLEPFAEHLYRELLATYAKLGRATDIQRVYRELEAALAEDLDAEPTEETAELRKKLIEKLSQGSDA
jgi:DNA-binding SARP family transcriptional activator